MIGIGVEIIAQERRRQVSEEGHTLYSDFKHTDESLAIAAACYSLPSDIMVKDQIENEFGIKYPRLWPKNWSSLSWKPSKDRIKQLAKAGALIAAEIDRISNSIKDITLYKIEYESLTKMPLEFRLDLIALIEKHKDTISPVFLDRLEKFISDDIGRPKVGEWYLPSPNHFFTDLKPENDERQVRPVQCVSDHNDRFWFTDYQSTCFSFVFPKDHPFNGWTKIESPQ